MRDVVILSIIFTFIARMEILANPGNTQDSLVAFSLIKYSETKETEHYVIHMNTLNEDGKHFLDSLIRVNHVHFTFYGERFIKLECDEMTYAPVSYLFEDNLSGILPYYKFLVGFNKIKNSNKKRIVIELNGKNFQIPLNI